MQKRHRYALEGVIIAAVVGVALVVLLNWESWAPKPVPLPDIVATPAAPRKAWKPSAKREAEANKGFAVEPVRKAEERLAGKQPGADWPTFNGSQRDNKSPERGLLQEWPEAGPPLLWTVNGLGAGYSGVSVVNGVAYTMGNKGISEAVVAFDVGTGEKIWSTPFGPASHFPEGEGPRSTPTVHNGAVYAMGGSGDLACFDAADGKIRWQKNIYQEFAAPVPYYGGSESVLIDGNRLICTPGGDKATLVALDAGSGELIWKSLLAGKDRVSYASVTIAEVDGVRQYVQFTSSGVVGVRADDGEFLWRDNSSANTFAICSSPLVLGDRVFSASGYNAGGTLLKLSVSGSEVKAEQVYHTEDMKNHHGDMVIVDGLIFGSDDPGILTCLDFETGKKKWQNRSVGKGSITYAEGRIYLRSESGPVALVEATGEGYRQRGKFTPHERSANSAWSHPVVAAGRLFLRDQDFLLCYDLKAPQ